MTDAPSKRCSVCSTTKPLAEFYKRPSGGPVTACIPCTLQRQREYQRRQGRPARREGQLRRSFGITVAKYDEMLAEQGGCCAICNEVETATDKRTGEVRYLSVDHCHRTGRVRRLLCLMCNLLVGNLEKHAPLVPRALAYIETHRQQPTINEVNT